jgi:Fur family ferric uptake transcriptional regulator
MSPPDSRASHAADTSHAAHVPHADVPHADVPHAAHVPHADVPHAAHVPHADVPHAAHVPHADVHGEWKERAEATLAAAGHRRGGARRALLELLDGQECALTAQEIEDALRARGGTRGSGGARSRRVSRASVYRILDELEQLRLVQRVETGQAMARYERVCEHSEHHHHHLVCDACGVVMPFSDAGLERAIETLSERVPLTVSEHEIVLHGACRDCAA